MMLVAEASGKPEPALGHGVVEVVRHDGLHPVEREAFPQLDREQAAQRERVAEEATVGGGPESAVGGPGRWSRGHGVQGPPRAARPPDGSSDRNASAVRPLSALRVDRRTRKRALCATTLGTAVGRAREVGSCTSRTTPRWAARWPWSSLVAVLPLLTLFVLLGGLRVRAWLASLIGLAVALARRDPGLRHAGLPGPARRHRGRGLRLLPDPLDRHQRAVDLPDDRVHRALRRAAAVVRLGLGRPAGPGRDHRLLLRRAARGARGLRHPGGDLHGHAHRPAVQPAQGRGGGPGGQHRAGRLRGDRRARSPRWPR